MKIGLQTYTIKKLIKSYHGLDDTMKTVNEMGIKHIELAYDYLKFPYEISSAVKIREIANKHNIEIISIQIRYATIMKDFDKAIEYIKALGAKYITVSLIDLRLMFKGEEGILTFCSRMNELYDRAAAYGIIVGHHNHHYECLKYNNKSVLDIMIENFKGEFALDTYWLQRGGINHLVILEKLKGRVSIMHLRDYKIKFSKLDLLGTDTEIGNGNLPFAEIIAKASQCGVKYGMIEQSTKTPLDSLKTSLNTINNL